MRMRCWAGKSRASTWCRPAMRVRIRHETSYAYDREVSFTSQLLRLTPLDHAGQRVLGWRVTAGNDKLLSRSDDGYGNVIHMTTVSYTHLTLPTSDLV